MTNNQMTKMKKITNIKAVGFDVDGTLYSYTTEASVDISRQVMERAAGELSKNLEEFEEEYLQKKEKYRSNTLTLQMMGLEGEQIYQDIFDKFPLEKYHKPDIRLEETMKKLASRYRLFIISNGTERQVRRKLKAIGLPVKMFEPFVCCYDHGWAKPEPAPFLYALQALALRPEEVVYVGDRADVDIEGAAQVGMRTILVGGEYEGATASCETVYDILSVL